MGVFKNEVGRPSNETLKKRKILIGGGIALFIFLVGTFYFIGLNSGSRYGLNSVNSPAISNSDLMGVISNGYSTFENSGSVEIHIGYREWFDFLGIYVHQSYAYAYVYNGKEHLGRSTEHCDEYNTSLDCASYTYEWYAYRRSGLKTKLQKICTGRTCRPKYLEKFYVKVKDVNGKTIQSATSTWSKLI